MARSKIIAPLALAALLPLAACATTTSTGPAEVTRFHRGEALAPGKVAIITAPESAGGAITMASSQAIGRELAMIGYPTAQESDARYIVTYRVEQGIGDSFGGGGPGVNVGVGGSTGGWRGGGIGVGVGLDLTSLFTKPRAQVNTRLSVTIRDRTTGTVVWEGRAENRSQVAQGEDPSSGIANKLASALFKDFPGQSGETITVK